MDGQEILRVSMVTSKISDNCHLYLITLTLLMILKIDLKLFNTLAVHITELCNQGNGVKKFPAISQSLLLFY